MPVIDNPFNPQYNCNISKEKKGPFASIENAAKKFFGNIAKKLGIPRNKEEAELAAWNKGRADFYK